MRGDKEKAIYMRKEGKSYTAISASLGVSKGTLSAWFGQLDWSNEIKKIITIEANKKSRERILHLNKMRKEKLNEVYQEAKEEAKREFETLRNEPLFVAGIMLYAGEGDKSGKNGLVRLSNIDPGLVYIFKKFIITYCFIPIDKIHFWVLLYPDHNIAKCEKYWEFETGISRERFYKSQIIQGRHKTNRLPYGVGNIIISKKCLKVKILEWVRLATENLSEK